MPLFTGFPSGQTNPTPVPSTFFTDLLPEIDHLDELRITLYVFWALNQQEGNLRFLTRRDFERDKHLMRALGRTQAKAQAALTEALERAVLRGSLLQAVVHPGETVEEVLFFINTARGRAALEALKNGEWSPTDQARPEIALDLERPNIFRLYEQNISPLTPLLADALREAEEIYPAEWIEEAIRAAVKANARSWRYVETILKRREKGRDGTARGKTEKSSRRYVEGELGEFVEH
ncbi:MAG TPA: DnaD domain protein [Anaerolineaceae bacterium]|nr:DnaD domain protein [Anaerolineaceae bacterium]